MKTILRTRRRARRRALASARRRAREARLDAARDSARQTRERRDRARRLERGRATGDDAMAEGAGPKIGDARSLWNFTPSPGWTKDEAYALRQCLKKFGIGKWVQIVDSGVLPGKQIQQLNGQTQRLLGIQSLAAYSGMKLDVDRIRMDNDALTDVTRKNGLITNQGGIRAKEALKELREENLKKYGLSEEEVEAIELPAPPRAAALGAQRYMGKNDIVPAEAKTIVKADATTLSPEGLNKSQKIAMLKALRSRVENLRVQLNEAATTAATTAENKAKTPAAKRATKTPVKRGNKKSKTDDSDDDESDGPVEMLMNMGFARKNCLDALDTCGGDVQECVEWLMTNCA